MDSKVDSRLMINNNNSNNSNNNNNNNNHHNHNHNNATASATNTNDLMKEILEDYNDSEILQNQFNQPHIYEKRKQHVFKMKQDEIEQEKKNAEIKLKKERKEQKRKAACEIQKRKFSIHCSVIVVVLSLFLYYLFFTFETFWDSQLTFPFLFFVVRYTNPSVQKKSSTPATEGG